jgi:predicted dehydrogenase
VTGDDDLRWGILGAGHIAHSFAADIAATPGNRVETIAARDPARAARLSERIGAGRVSHSYEALVADPAVDVVYIATVNSVHRDHALLALDAGKNVVIEKPLATTVAAASEIADRARRSGRFCMEGMWMRMHPLIRQASELVAAGAVGDVLSVRADLSTSHPYAPHDRLFDPAAGGGALLDLGVYPAHFAWMLLGSPARVTAALTFAPSGADDSAALQWSYPNGTFAQLYAGFRGPSALGGIVTGTSGFLQLGPRLNRPRQLTIHSGRNAPRTEIADLPGNGFAPEITEVNRCIRAGLRESPLAPLSDSVAVLATLDHARRERDTSLLPPDLEPGEGHVGSYTAARRPRLWLVRRHGFHSDPG